MDVTWETIATTLYKATLDPEDLVPVICLCLMADALSVYFWLARCRKGYGASGLAGITWIFYFLLTLFSRESILFRQEPVILFKLLDLAVLSLFHALCHFIVPWLYGAWLNRVGLK